VKVETKKPNRIEPRVVVMFCQNAAPGVETGDAIRKGDGFLARLVVLPCSSKIEIMHLVKVLAAGEDGVEIVGCPPAKCGLQGQSVKAGGRVDYLRAKLRELGMNPERVGMTYASGLSRADLMRIAAAVAERVRGLGPGARPAAEAENDQAESAAAPAGR
jgi:F420-non-reducing hydrogenase iron-sulfur subunit